MVKFPIYFLILSSVLLLSCRHDDSTSQFIKVYKSDGSIQCESEGVSLQEMMFELVNAGIDVVCAQTGHDGLLRPTVCGAGTGNINIYEINNVNYDDAERLGFMTVSTLPEYQDQVCDPG